LTSPWPAQIRSDTAIPSLVLTFSCALDALQTIQLNLTAMNRLEHEHLSAPFTVLAGRAWQITKYEIVWGGKWSLGLEFRVRYLENPAIALIGRRRCSPERGCARAPSWTSNRELVEVQGPFCDRSATHRNSEEACFAVSQKLGVSSAKMPGRGRARARFALALGHLGQNRPSSV
jgi:hypothetical protein